MQQLINLSLSCPVAVFTGGCGYTAEVDVVTLFGVNVEKAQKRASKKKGGITDPSTWDVEDYQLSLDRNEMRVLAKSLKVYELEFLD